MNYQTEAAYDREWKQWSERYSRNHKDVTQIAPGWLLLPDRARLFSDLVDFIATQSKCSDPDAAPSHHVDDQILNELLQGNGRTSVLGFINGSLSANKMSAPWKEFLTGTSDLIKLERFPLFEAVKDLNRGTIMALPFSAQEKARLVASLLRVPHSNYNRLGLRWWKEWGADVSAEMVVEQTEQLLKETRFPTMIGKSFPFAALLFWIKTHPDLAKRWMSSLFKSSGNHHSLWVSTKENMMVILGEKLKSFVPDAWVESNPSPSWSTSPIGLGWVEALQAEEKRLGLSSLGSSAARWIVQLNAFLNNKTVLLDDPGLNSMHVPNALFRERLAAAEQAMMACFQDGVSAEQHRQSLDLLFRSNAFGSWIKTGQEYIPSLFTRVFSKHWEANPAFDILTHGSVPLVQAFQRLLPELSPGDQVWYAPFWSAGIPGNAIMRTEGLRMLYADGAPSRLDAVNTPLMPLFSAISALDKACEDPLSADQAVARFIENSAVNMENSALIQTHQWAFFHGQSFALSALSTMGETMPWMQVHHHRMHHQQRILELLPKEKALPPEIRWLFGVQKVSQVEPFLHFIGTPKNLIDNINFNYWNEGQALTYPLLLCQLVHFIPPADVKKISVLGVDLEAWHLGRFTVSKIARKTEHFPEFLHETTKSGMAKLWKKYEVPLLKYQKSIQLHEWNATLSELNSFWCSWAEEHRLRMLASQSRTVLTDSSSNTPSQPSHRIRIT